MNQRHARSQVRHAQLKAIDALGREADDLVRIALFQRVSIDEFRRQFGSLSEIDDDSGTEPSTRTYRYVHPASGYAFVLTFRDDILTGFHGLITQRPPSSRNPANSCSVNPFVVGVLQICVILWVVVLIGLLARPHWRRTGSCH